MIEKVFNLLDSCRLLPAYQLERRADIFFANKEPRRKQRGILKGTLSYFTPQEAGNMTNRDSQAGIGSNANCSYIQWGLRR